MTEQKIQYASIPDETPSGWKSSIGIYLRRQATSPGRYVLEQLLYFLAGWIPSIIGIGIRSVLYRLILHLTGPVAIENGVRIRFADHISLGRGAYIDQGCYLHGCPNGIVIGENSYIMHGSILHVYNFRNLPSSQIRIGKECVIGEFNVFRGQGGLQIGDRVYTGPMVQMLAVDHVFDDPTRPMRDQGITARGIIIDDDVYVGAGATVLDGVHIGKGAVVAAGAVVTEDVAEYTVVGGVPGRLLRVIETKSASGEERNGRQ